MSLELINPDDPPIPGTHPLAAALRARSDCESCEYSQEYSRDEPAG
jgi:hypothetical protein